MKRPQFPIQVTEDVGQKPGEQIDVLPQWSLLRNGFNRFSFGGGNVIHVLFHVGCKGTIKIEETLATELTLVCQKCHRLKVPLPRKVVDGTFDDLITHFAEVNIPLQVRYDFDDLLRSSRSRSK